MADVRIPLKLSRRGNYSVFRYVFRIGIYANSTPVRLPCLIDTAFEFTTVSLPFLQQHRIHIARLAPAEQIQFLNGPNDYLGSFLYGFPWNSDTVQLGNMQFRCEQCRVTRNPLSHVHFALRDIRLHFDPNFDHGKRELVLTLRPGNLGFPATP
jgi:hypothetical protein